jgi:hypothetical protein
MSCRVKPRLLRDGRDLPERSRANDLNRSAVAPREEIEEHISQEADND